MQVNLLSSNDAAVPDKRIAGVLLLLQGGSFEPLLQHQTRTLRERAGREDERDPVAAAAQAATRSADVIKEAERNIERSSRAFRRQVAHDSGVEQFRQERQGLRQALQEKAAGPSSRGSSGMGGRSEPEATPKSGDKSTVANNARPTTAHLAKTPATGPATSSLDNRAADAVSTRAASASQPPPSSLGSPAISTTNAGNTVAGRVMLNAVSAMRPAASLQLQVAGRPSAANSAKGNAQTPVGPLSARGSTKAGASSATRANGSRAAENADRTANIERIVRLVAQRIRGERSHTVMRLDPPELGSLRLQMDLKGAALTLRIDTSTHVAHRLLSEDVDKLRQGLETSGIQLERVDIRPPTRGPEAGEQGNSQHTEGEGGPKEGFGEPDAEHPEEHGRDSHPARSDEGATRGAAAEPAAESLVNVVA